MANFYTHSSITALAGMIGFTLVSCGSANDAETAKLFEKRHAVSVEPEVVLMESDFEGKALFKGMAMKQAKQNLEFLGWKYSEGIRVSGAGMSNLWMREPCRAASIENTQAYKTLSNERPPRNLRLIATFYECVDDEPVNIGRLAELRIEEEPYVKNQ